MTPTRESGGPDPVLPRSMLMANAERWQKLGVNREGEGGGNCTSKAVAQPQWVSWVSGHPQKFKLGVSDTPQKS